jgi:alanine dehydrogenase
VPNYTAAVARTTSYAITNAALPYLLAVGENDLANRARLLPALIEGVNLYKGKVSHPAIASALGVEQAVDLMTGLHAGDSE